MNRDKITFSTYQKYVSLPTVLTKNSVNELLEKLNLGVGTTKSAFQKELEDSITRKEKQIMVKKYLDSLGEDYRHYTIEEQNLDMAAELTTQLIKSQEFDVIINPVFKYQNAYAKVSVINLKDQKIVVLSPKTSRKITDHLRAYFYFNIFTYYKDEQFPEWNPVWDYQMGTIKEDGELIVSKYGFTGKTAPKKAVKKVETALTAEELVEYNKSLKLFGHRSVEEFRNNEFVEYTKYLQTIANEGITYLNRSSLLKLDLAPLPTVIEEINALVELDKQGIIDNVLNFESNQLTDTTKFNEILRGLVPQLREYSTFAIKNEEVVNVLTNGEELIDGVLADLRQNQEVNSEVVADWLSTVENKKLVFYDFETFTSALINVENVSTFEQVPFMVAVKEVKSDGKKGDLWVKTYDPVGIGVEHFKELVDSLYKYYDENTCYVAYNASFEIGVLKNMKQWINSDIYSAKIDQMIESTVDPMELFNSRGGNPAIYLPELKGYYGLKKLMAILAQPEQFISKNNRILDGEVATKIGLARHYEILNDGKFNDLVPDLEIYNISDVNSLHFLVDWIKQQV